LFRIAIFIIFEDKYSERWEQRQTEIVFRGWLCRNASYILQI